MRGPYLVDTNIVIWAWHKPHKIPRRLLKLLETDAEFHVSVASIWEICIKASIGKLGTVDNVAETLISTGYNVLPIKIAHAEAVRHLPLHHRDPFDRMLICQAQLEGMTVVTVDRDFRSYDVDLA